MIIKLDHIGNEHFEAKNETGGAVRIDGTGEIGNMEGGLSPMQLLLAAIGGCSAIDIIGILEKQRQDLREFEIIVEGDKQKRDTYSVFETIHIHYRFKGLLEDSKAKRAIELSLGKYCSVSKALEKGSKIDYSFEITDP